VVTIVTDDITAPDEDGTILVPLEIQKTEKPSQIGDYRCSILAVTADGQHHETIGTLTVAEQIGTVPA